MPNLENSAPTGSETQDFLLSGGTRDTLFRVMPYILDFGTIKLTREGDAYCKASRRMYCNVLNRGAAGARFRVRVVEETPRSDNKLIISYDKGKLSAGLTSKITVDIEANTPGEVSDTLEIISPDKIYVVSINASIE